MLVRIFVFLFLAFLPFSLQAQRVTKEQLLKLFYQAHTAQNNNDMDRAIDVYKKILTLSPGLPDPYLQLGNIYAGKTEDADALEKACICYANYLELNPEAADAENLKTKISELTLSVKQLRQEGLQIHTSQQELALVVPLPESKQQMAAMNYTLSVPKIVENTDTVAVVDSVKTEKVLNVSPIDDKLLGRWVSAELGTDGRELWMLDVEKRGEDFYISLNDSSCIQRTDEILKHYPMKEIEAQIDGANLMVSYVQELKSDDNKNKSSGLKDFFDDYLNVKLKLDLFSDDTSKTAPVDSATSVSDTLAPIVPVTVYSYLFRLTFDGTKLGGTIACKVIKKDTVETVLSERISDCELFKAPSDYLGFTYEPLATAEEKATMLEFQQLLNKKLQDAMESSSAINDLGCMYASGIGVRRNMKMAVAYFMEASMKRNLFGMLNMAQLYVDGLGVERDLDKARVLYNQAFEEGYSDAMVMCGDTYLVEDDYKSALDCYLKAALRRCPYSYYRLGWFYKEGLGIEKDTTKALEYYQKAVEMQYPAALLDYAHFYKEGNLVTQDNDKAMELLMKAAEKGNASAMYSLYEIYLRGEGVAPNFMYAKDWYQKSMAADDELIGGFNTVKSQVKNILSLKKR